MKKINLKRLSSILSEKEMKNVLGGSWTWGCQLRCGNNYYLIPHGSWDQCWNLSDTQCGGLGSCHGCS